jgi:hypothetical protein
MYDCSKSYTVSSRVSGAEAWVDADSKLLEEATVACMEEDEQPRRGVGLP